MARKRSHQVHHGSANRPRFYGKHAVSAALDNPERRVLKAWATLEATEFMQFPKDMIVTRAEVTDLARMVPNDAPHQGVVIEVEPLEDLWLADVLTARGEEDDRVRGLETGADDYVTKPFSPKELVARAAAVLRRVRPALAAEMLTYSGIEMDLAAHKVRRDGGPLQLGPTEYRLLRHFLEKPGRVFSRQQLLEMVWPHSEDIELRTVDVHIRRLRLALGDPDPIRTVRSAGYALDAEGVT